MIVFLEEVIFFLTALIIALILVFIAFQFQFVIHELGHLLFGLLSGYRLLSFRIYSVMWVRSAGKIQRKRYSLTGTAGQCLMEPPEIAEGKIPFVLYNAGGVLMNLISSLLFLGGSMLLHEYFELSLALQIFGIAGLFIAFTNGIPLPLKMVHNDGSNLVSLLKSKRSVYAFWLQLKINALLVEGRRMKDMPAEWFELPTAEEMNNSISATIAVMACGRLMDQLRCEEADKLMADLLQRETKIAGIHRMLLTNDRIYCELVNQNRPDYLKIFKDKQQQKFMDSMKDSLAVLRTRYTYELLANRNVEASQAFKNQFNKYVLNYPYPAEADSEWELICYADEVYEKRKGAS